MSNYQSPEIKSLSKSTTITGGMKPNGIFWVVEAIVLAGYYAVTVNSTVAAGPCKPVDGCAYGMYA